MSSSGSSGGRPTVALVSYVAALGATAAVLAYVLGLVGADAPGDPVWAVLPVLGGLVVAAECLLVRFRLGRHVDALNLVEAALAPLLFAYPGPVVVGTVAAAQVVSALLRRNNPLKGAFNVAQWSLAAGVGSLVVAVLAPDSTAGVAGVLLLALTAVGLVNAAAMTLVLAIAQHSSLRQQLSGLQPVVLAGWFGGWSANVLIGLLFVAAYAGQPASALLFAAPLVLAHLAYRGYATARADRLRLAGLRRATGALTSPLDPRDGIAEYLSEVADCFEARVVELVLRAGAELEVHRLDAANGRLRKTVQRADAVSLEAALAALPAPKRVTGTAQDPLAPILVDAGWRDCLSAPMVDDGRVIGAVLVLDQAGLEGAAAGELAVLEALARETAAAFAKGRLLKRVIEERRRVSRLAEAEAAQRIVVEELQQAVTPACPDVRGTDLSVAYVASDATAPTGGDLYDWQLLPSGELHLAVVDVMGHGVTATKDALAVAHTLRLVAVDGTPVEQMVKRADELLAAQNPDLVATVMVARYDPANGHVRVASGGHPPALVVSPHGKVRQVVASGGAIGWPGAGSDTVAEFELRVHEALVLYTDGLIEARKDVIEGMDALVRTAGEIAHLPVDRFADELVTRSLAGAERRDDSLALLMRRVPVDARSGQVRWQTGPDDRSVTETRRRFVMWLDQHDLVSDEAEVVAGELLGNAARAARSSVTLRAEARSEGVVLEVSDDGHGDPDLDAMGRRLPGNDSEGGRGLFLVRTLASDIEVFSSAAGSVVRCLVPLHRPAVARPRAGGAGNVAERRGW